MKLFLVLPLLLMTGGAGAADDLSLALSRARSACGGIGASLSGLKTMAGINTAVTGVGTVAGGVALGTGIAKSETDKRAEKLDEKIAELETAGAREIKTSGELYSVLAQMFQETGTAAGNEIAAGLYAKRQELEQKSKKLGNWRTGTLAASTATNIAGAVIAGNNRVRDDLLSQINNCVQATKVLSVVKMQTRDATSPETLQRIDKIISECGEWETVDLSKINIRGRGATISSAIGATTGAAGIITSASANSDATRNDNSDAGKRQEKNLNTVSNVLAGATTAASATATVFNATQISAIKRAVKVADACEGALK